MKSDKELFNLAKSYAHLEDQFQTSAIEFELEEVIEEMQEIRDTLLKKDMTLINLFNTKICTKK